MEDLLVPIDDPADGRLALRTAFGVAKRAGRSVGLLSWCTPDEADDRRETLSNAATPFTGLAPWSVEITTDAAGPAEAILSTSRSREAMICMPTRSRGGVSRLLFGSVAEAVVRQSTQPTLCLGPEVRNIPSADEAIEVLVATDDSVASPSVLAAAGSFARALDATCIVAQVVGPDEDVGPLGQPPPRPLRERARAHVDAAARHLETSGVSASGEVLPGRAAESIVARAASRSAGFIVVGTTGRTGLSRYALGSVAIGVVRNARCPVLVVPTLEHAP